MHRYSYSQIQTYAACPTRYKFRYVDHLVPLTGESSHDLKFGRAIDAALSAYYVNNLSVVEAKAAFILSYPVSDYPETLPYWSPGKTFNNGLNAISAYDEHWQDDNQYWEVVGVQSSESVEDVDSDRLVKIDLVIRDRRDGLIYGVDFKAQPLWSKLLTPNGWVSMSNAYVGMPLFGRDGEVHEVTGVYPQGIKECFEVSFSDGSKAHCSGDHLWTVTMQYHSKEITLTLNEIVKRMTKKRNVKRKQGDKRSSFYSYKYRVPLIDPIALPERNLPIDPYLLGVLLGDGCLCVNSPQVSIGEQDRKAMLVNLKECLPPDIELRKCGGRNFSWNLADKSVKSMGRGKGMSSNKLMTALSDLGLRGRKSHDKFVPPSYLNGSIGQRLHLLQGLLDTDGCCSDGHIYFDSTSPQLARDVVTLVRSLGGYAQSRKITKPSDRLPATRVSIRPIGFARMFRLDRKQDKVRRLSRKEGKYITKVEMVGVVNMQCIKTSAPDGLYITDEFTVTHNSTGKYLDKDFNAKFDPHSQIRQYVDRLQRKYGEVGGFYIDALSFRHRTKAYTPRQGPDKGVQLPAGDWYAFKRLVFNPNTDAVQAERANFDSWVRKIEADRESGLWGYNTEQCVRGPLVCEYHQICSAGYQWPRDAELITNYYRQQCIRLVGGERCQLDAGHEGEHDPTRQVQPEFEIENDEIEDAIV